MNYQPVGKGPVYIGQAYRVDFTPAEPGNDEAVSVVVRVRKRDYGFTLDTITHGPGMPVTTSDDTPFPTVEQAQEAAKVEAVLHHAHTRSFTWPSDS